ncbi:MAG: inositol monophosphatase family protein [Acidimicrobiia bacterium]
MSDVTNTFDLEKARDVAISASNKAAYELEKRFRTELNVQSKGYADFVTELDHLCEEIIEEELSTFDDSIKFMGEESTNFEVKNDELVVRVPETCWIVDPLDGTSNYSHGFQSYGVSIALRINNELSVGVVNCPSLNRCYSSIINQGSYCQEGAGKQTKLQVKDNGDRFNIFATSFPFRKPEYIEEHMELVKKLFTIFEDLRRVGAASLDLCWVADGTFAAFIERFLKPWDVAAGGLILKEAGGVVTDYSGDSNNWLTNGEILATSSARVHEQIMTLLD